MTKTTLRIGGASGFWGDASGATAQLLADGDIDFIVYDYLAEITMSIMARARLKDPGQGYARDFVSAAMAPNLARIAAQGVRIVSNAGGVNPEACAAALRAEIEKQSLDLKVACVLGDDLFSQKEQLAKADIAEMFSGGEMPDPERFLSINAYLGAFPIAEALNRGADIVVTGRCVDSAVTLGACIHHFDWTRQDHDLLAMGSLAGHVIECGPQATGGNFTDWREVAADIDTVGYPIAEVSADGSFICTKPDNTGGQVSIGTVSEQMLYEIGDPQAYILPDVVCDFSQVTLEQLGEDRVRLQGATGLPAPDTYKVCATYADQFRGGTVMTFYGRDAADRARALCEAALRAARKLLNAYGLPDYSETSIEVIGAESHYGAFAARTPVREVAVKLAVKHADAAGVGILLKEMIGLGLATPPGLCGFQGGRPKPSPVVRLYSFLHSRADLPVTIEMDGEIISCDESAGEHFDAAAIQRPGFKSGVTDASVEVDLIDLAWARSGDKGDKANIGVIARKPEYFPYIEASLSADVVQQRLAHFIDENCAEPVERYLLPGSNAINFLIHDVLGGGGVASIRSDPQAKGYSQLILECPVKVSKAIAESLS